MCHLCILVQIHVFRSHWLGIDKLVDTCFPGVCSVEHLRCHTWCFFLLVDVFGECIFRLVISVFLVFTHDHDAGEDYADKYQDAAHEFAYLTHRYSSDDHHT